MTTTPAKSTPIDTTAPIQRSVPTKSSASTETSLPARKPTAPLDFSEPAAVAAKAQKLAGERRREAAIRAAAEAAERHAVRGTAQPEKGERSGRGGLDPVRYGDWEVKGIATDF